MLERKRGIPSSVAQRTRAPPGLGCTAGTQGRCQFSVHTCAAEFVASFAEKGAAAQMYVT